MKMKRSNLLPLVLLIYLLGMAVYAWPERNSGITEIQYWSTIGITLVCIIALTYFLKRRDKFRDKDKKQR